MPEQAHTSPDSALHLSGNHLLNLQEQPGAWKVLSGSLDLFAAPIQNGKPAGIRKHIARLQHPFLLGLEITQNFQRHIRLQRQILLPANAPAPLALRLQQKYVVAVKVRPDATAIGGKAHHQIIQPRARHKRKLL